MVKGNYTDPERAMKLALGLVEKHKSDYPYHGKSREEWREIIKEQMPNYDEVYAGCALSAEENLDRAIRHLNSQWVEYPEPDISVESIMVEFRVEIAKTQFLQQIAKSLEALVKQGESK